MSKYNKGDKFILEIDSEVYEGDMANISPKYYTLKGLSGLEIIEENLDKLQKCETELSWDEAYIKGLEDAWNLAIKLWLPSSYGGLKGSEVMNIFDCDYYAIAKLYTPQEALAKLEAYEKENEIKVGDVVEIESTKECYVILAIYGKIIWGYSCEGNESPLQELDGVTITKTGKHIDITSALEQLRGDEA